METPTNHKGKRKAEEVDVTPPDQKTGQRATFVIPETGRRPHHESESSHAPSSYHRKRVRLSATTPTPSPSRPGSTQNAENTGSWSKRTAPSPIPGHLHLHRSASRATSTRSQQAPPTPTGSNHDSRRGTMDRRRSMSEMSIPISALIAPHAPSVSRSSTYHMRDPKRPPAVRPTSWSLHFKNEDEDGSPLHAWCFFLGFVLFPLWWVASFVPIPETRRVGGTDTEKAVTLDDPQVEQDARSWRFRCRIMAGVAVVTYIPFIILIAIFVPR
ncbi:hypothetical protein BXZ70DRAFT_1002288 [Cristinia sonorae]|uniref:Uncharacterized protein n=1 Tax=Cristinia sonorae TaxID=1940300 RepID=A0A8K0UFM1_9AGAR|nr:hypothetical protein BXZ70DRAFT_1002288 [Cristinia sonorae]